MAEIIEALNGATESTESTFTEVDQPDTRPVVSLEQILGDEPTKAADGQQKNGAETGNAAPQPAPAQETVYRTQADFDRAFGQRSAGLRKQWERENAEDFAIAKAIRSRFPGKNPAEIHEAILQEEARQLAVDTGYSEEEAVQKVRARRDYERRASLPDGVDPDILDKMAGQMADFQQKYGIDLVPVMEADESLLQLVTSDGDLRDVMIAVLAKGGSTQKTAQEAAKQVVSQMSQQQKSAPKVETSGAARSTSTARKMTDKEFDRINAALESGIRVALND